MSTASSPDASGPRGAADSAGASSPGRDWTDEVADLIETTVANVRDRTVEPVRKVTRAVVFGTLAIGFAVPAAVLALIMMFRLLVVLCNLLPGPDDNAWMAWDLLGLGFVAAGLFVFNRRHATGGNR
jgi:hypothetical protein